VNSYAAHDEASHCARERPNPGTLAEYKDEGKESPAMTSRDTYDILTYEEEQEESMNGINIQINTLVDAMIDAEKCLFHNSPDNLMVNSLLSEVAGVEETKSPFVFRGSHPDLPVGK
jgi:hypothetical protein